MLRKAFQKIRKHPNLLRYVERLGKRIPILRYHSWKLSAQEFEFAFHKGPGGLWRMSSDFMRQTTVLFEFWGYPPDKYDGCIILDLGAGSKLRSKYFRNARIFAIEPLASRFKELPFSDLGDAEAVYSLPAEDLVEELKGKVSFLMCINVLDHVFDPRHVLENCLEYLSHDAEFLLSTDLHKELRDEGHPVGFTQESLLSLVAEVWLRGC